MLADVGERLLGHAIDHELLVVADRVGLALGAQHRLDPVLVSEAAHLALERRLQAVVVECCRP